MRFRSSTRFNETKSPLKTPQSGKNLASKYKYL